MRQLFLGVILCMSTICGVILAFGIFLGWALFASSPARAQEPGPGDMGFHHDLNHDWYQHLKQPNNPDASCCNGTAPGVIGDCRPTKAYKMGKTWMALISGEWRAVPPEVVKPSSFNREPYQAHVCASSLGTIYCFIEKEGGT